MGEDLDKIREAETSKAKENFYCSFCGKNQHDVLMPVPGGFLFATSALICARRSARARWTRGIAARSRQHSWQRNAAIANLVRSGTRLPTCSGRSSGCGSPDGVIHQDSRTALENAATAHRRSDASTVSPGCNVRRGLTCTWISSIVFQSGPRSTKLCRSPKLLDMMVHCGAAALRSVVDFDQPSQMLHGFLLSSDGIYLSSPRRREQGVDAHESDMSGHGVMPTHSQPLLARKVDVDEASAI
jgi:hypothetical protein